MTLQQAMHSLRIIDDNGYKCIQSRKWQHDFTNFEICIIPDVDQTRCFYSEYCVDGFYGFRNMLISDPAKFRTVLQPTKDFSLKELTNSWELFFHELPYNGNAWQHYYYNVRYHYFSDNYKQIFC